MADTRIHKLAHTIVAYSSAVKANDTVALLGDPTATLLLREIYQEVTLAGGLCVLIPTDGNRALTEGVVFADGVMSDFFIRHANETQMNWMSPLEAWVSNEADVMINIRSTDNTRRGSSIDPKRLAMRAASRAELSKTRFIRSASAEQRW